MGPSRILCWSRLATICWKAESGVAPPCQIRGGPAGCLGRVALPAPALGDGEGSHLSGEQARDQG